MTERWEIRLLDQRDRPLILASDAFDGPPLGDETDAFLADPRHLIVGAIIEGALIGFASGVMMLHPDKRPVLFISEVGVNEAHQRRGIGRSLVEALMEAGRSRGSSGIWVATEAENAPARALYRAVGARETAGIVVYDWDGAMDD